MKNIKLYESENYKDHSKYKPLGNGIYETTDEENKKVFVTSLSFEQERELNEGDNAASISQYPLEDILDNFKCHVSNFYKELNTPDSFTCYLEFCAPYKQCINEVVSLVGKHVYNKEIDGSIYLMADEEVVCPLVIPVKQIYRRNGTKEQKRNDILGLITMSSIALVLIGAIAICISKNTFTMILLSIGVIGFLGSGLTLSIMNPKNKPNKNTNSEALLRKEKNHQILNSKGIKINEYLPVIETTSKLKDLNTITKRAIACLISVQLSCDLNENRTDSKDFFIELLKKYKVEDCLNSLEKKIFNGTYTKQDLIDMDWEYEDYWALVWALGLIPDIQDGGSICDCEKAVHLVVDTKSLEEFQSKCHLRSKNEILDMLDLYYRYHWAVVEKRIHPETNIGNLDSSVVKERRRGLEWLVSEEEDWFNIDLNT